MSWHDIFIVVFFVAAIALGAVTYRLRDKDWQPLAAALLAGGSLFTGVALLLDDWVVVVGLAAGAVTAVAVGYGAFGLADFLDSRDTGDEQELPRYRREVERAHEYAQEAESRARAYEHDMARAHEHAQEAESRARAYEQEMERAREQAAEAESRTREYQREIESREAESERAKHEEIERIEARIAAAAAGLRSDSQDDRFAATAELAAVAELAAAFSSPHWEQIRNMLAGHIRVRARNRDDGVSPDVETALVALGRGAGSDGPPRAPVNLARAQLRGLVLVDADLPGAVLVGADFEGALLDNVNLAGARLTDASLRGVRLHDVDLSEASLSGADLGGATYDEATQWPIGFDPAAAIVPQR